MFILKIDGSAMQNASLLAAVKHNIRSLHTSGIIIVSALEGVTRRLEAICEKSLLHGEGYEQELEDLKTLHLNLANELLPPKARDGYESALRSHFEEIDHILHHVAVLKGTPRRMTDYILPKGDLLASLLFSQILPESSWLDARNFISADPDPETRRLLWEESCRTAALLFNDWPSITVVPARGGKTPCGYTVAPESPSPSTTAAVLEAVFPTQQPPQKHIGNNLNHSVVHHTSQLL